VHQLILTAHPGSVDELNPGFKVWTEQGYREALQLVPRVNNYDSMMAAARYYVTGFRDGHLLYSHNTRRDYPMLVNGWRLRKQGSDYVVDAQLKEWPAPLPPLGSTLLQCDGRKADTILAEDTAPYINRRTTGADTLYIDTGRAKLPSGNALVMPQKVWRNRLRGNDEALVPGIVLKADLDDDAAVRAETLAALRPR